MESRLAPEQASAIQRMQALAAEHGLNMFLIGSALRDIMCGHPIRDLEFCVEGNPAKLFRAFEKFSDIQIRDVEDDRKVARVAFPGGVEVEIGQCRSERYSKTGAEPDITPGSIYDDLRRRDFSMNAIGLSLNPASRGLVLDPTNGAGDIERREIRSLHNYTFVDDPVRMLRLVRFRTRYQFGVDPKTESQFQSAKERELLEYALPRSLAAELREIARDPSPTEILKALEKEGMSTALHPKLEGQRLNLQALGKMEKLARWLEEQGLRPSLYGPAIFFLTQKLPPADRAGFAKRLHMRRADSDPWLKLEDEAKKMVKQLGGKDGNTPSKAFQLLSRQPAELILFTMLQFPQKKIQDKIKHYLTRHRPLREKLPEKELEGLGVAPNTPRFSKILDQFFTAVIDGKVKSRTDQQKYLKKLAAETK